VTDRYRLVPAAYVLLRRAGAGGADEVLLQLRRDTGFMDGYWAAAAAGHVEAGESVLAAACREVTEELGVTVAPADLVPVTAMHRTQATGDPVDERVDFFFECRRWSGQPHLVEPHKAADLGWFSLDSLPDPVVPHEQWVLERLGDRMPPVVTYGFSERPGSAVPLTHE
jgi:8-oxo-dGTP pyrophosphatase MutT (NUDIX family)